MSGTLDETVSPLSPPRLSQRLLTQIDGVLFGFAGLAAVWLAVLLLQVGIAPGWPLLLLVPFWLLVTYLALPRVHRILTNLYVPGYFIGRTRTSDGLLGDPVNLALRGTEAQVHDAMTGAGWTRADDLTVHTGMQIVRTTLGRRSYAAAPVSPLMLFDRQQDFAYEREVEGNPAKRHHVRFWRCPDGWFLPGGTAVDWVAAGTYDKRVGLSLFTLQITHKIEADTDVERDFIVSSLTSTHAHAQVEVIQHFSSGYHARNGGGDRIETDGDLPIVVVGTSPGPPEAVAPGPTDSRDRRPVQTVFGSLVSFGRGLLWVLAAVAVYVAPATLMRAIQDSDDAAQLADHGLRAALAVMFVLLALGEVGLGLAVFLGRNWARLWSMGWAVVTTAGAFVSNVTGKAPTLLDLPATASAVLLLLALSSHRARAYASRRRSISARPSTR